MLTNLFWFRLRCSPITSVTLTFIWCNRYIVNNKPFIPQATVLLDSYIVLFPHILTAICFINWDIHSVSVGNEILTSKNQMDKFSTFVNNTVLFMSVCFPQWWNKLLIIIRRPQILHIFHHRLGSFSESYKESLCEYLLNCAIYTIFKFKVFSLV